MNWAHLSETLLVSRLVYKINRRPHGQNGQIVDFDNEYLPIQSPTVMWIHDGTASFAQWGQQHHDLDKNLMHLDFFFYATSKSEH